MMPDQEAIDALAEAWAETRHLGEQYRLERDNHLEPGDPSWKGTKDFCEGEADFLYNELRSRGFDIVRKE